MTGYESKRAAAQDKLAQPAQEPNWICNECGAQEFTAALSEADLDYLACSNCGGNEFHKEALAQPVQEPVAWMYPDALCDRACLYVCTKAFTQFPECATTPPQPTVQVSPLEFVEMVMEKEHLVGNPIVWAQWPNKEKNT